MKKYKDQGKVDTRSGFGSGRLNLGGLSTFYIASAIIVLCTSSCVLLSPIIELNAPPEVGKNIFCYSNECYINGERKYVELYRYYSLDEYYWYKGRHIPQFVVGFGGNNAYDENGNPVFKNYDNLYFISELEVGEMGCVPLFFMIVGNGYGPFKTGVDYSSRDNIVIYYPYLYSWYDVSNKYSYIYGDSPRPNEHKSGVSAKLLSGSFKFGYSKMDNDGLSIDILDFYYDFEEVITSLQKKEYLNSLQVGDTVRVTNGHLRQAVSGIHEDKRINIKRLVSDES